VQYRRSAFSVRPLAGALSHSLRIRDSRFSRRPDRAPRLVVGSLRVTALVIVLTLASATASAARPHALITTPSAPLGVTAISGNASATVHWTAPVTDGGAPVTKYTATAHPGTKSCRAPGTRTSCVISGLANGSRFSFTVTATNRVGTSVPSLSSLSVTIGAPSAPTAAKPTRLRLGKKGDNFTGIALDPAGDIFVSASNLTQVLERTDAGAVERIGSDIKTPYGVAVDRWGDAYVAGWSSGDIDEIYPDGSEVQIDSGLEPNGLAVESSGDVLVANYGFNDIVAIPPLGAPTTIGSGFLKPTDVAVDASGDVFVADYGHRRIEEILASGGQRQVGPSFTFNGDHPLAVAVGPSGAVYATDDEDRLFELSSAGRWLAIGTGFSAAVDSLGDVFFGDGKAPPTVEVIPAGPWATPRVARATVSWGAPLADGASAITRFVVTAAPGNETCTTTGALSCAVNGLTAGQHYSFTVRAYNAIGASVKSSASNPVSIP